MTWALKYQATAESAASAMNFVIGVMRVGEVY